MSILPIDEDVLDRVSKEEEEEKKQENIKVEVVELEEPQEKEENNEAPQEIFEKPVEISKKTGKPKRKLTQSQIDGLAKAREKSAAKRRALKEAKEIEKEEKRLKRAAANEEKVKKREEEESRIRLAAQLKMDAEKASHWSEDRLAKLMEKTLDNYIAKKKKMKPAPRESIPYQAESKPLPSPQQQSRQRQAYYQPQPYHDPTPHYQQATHRSALSQEANIMNTMFGNFTDN